MSFFADAERHFFDHYSIPVKLVYKLPCVFEVVFFYDKHRVPYLTDLEKQHATLVKKTDLVPAGGILRNGYDQIAIGIAVNITRAQRTEGRIPFII